MQDGLVEVAPTTHEYWDVFDQLRQEPSNCNWGRMDDAWISKLHRIQNLHLYTYFDFQKKRLHKTAREGTVHHSASSQNVLQRTFSESSGDVNTVDGWHGTGDFDAANIYLDRQDGEL